MCQGDLRTGPRRLWHDAHVRMSGAKAKAKAKLTAALAEAFALDRTRHGRDINLELQRLATRASAEFVHVNMPRADSVSGSSIGEASERIMEMALDLAPETGLVLEFGVATGATLRQIVRRRPDAHGFDSFEGLPERWRVGFDAGTFKQPPPDVHPATLHVGLFEDSLPGFLEMRDEPFAFVHMDADLYSSSATVFRLAEDRFVTGTVILFDEYLNYPGWQHGEHKAFFEFAERTGHDFDYVAYNPLHEQVIVRLTS